MWCCGEASIHLRGRWSVSRSPYGPKASVLCARVAGGAGCKGTAQGPLSLGPPSCSATRVAPGPKAASGTPPWEREEVTCAGHRRGTSSPSSQQGCGGPGVGGTVGVTVVRLPLTACTCDPRGHPRRVAAVTGLTQEGGGVGGGQGGTRARGGCLAGAFGSLAPA